MLSPIWRKTRKTWPIWPCPAPASERVGRSASVDGGTHFFCGPHPSPSRWPSPSPLPNPPTPTTNEAERCRKPKASENSIIGCWSHSRETVHACPQRRTSTLPYSRSYPNPGNMSWAASCCVGENQERVLHPASPHTCSSSCPTNRTQVHPLHPPLRSEIRRRVHMHATLPMSISSVAYHRYVNKKNTKLSFPLKRPGIQNKRISKGEINARARRDRENTHTRIKSGTAKQTAKGNVGVAGRRSPVGKNVNAENKQWSTRVECPWVFYSHNVQNMWHKLYTSGHCLGSGASESSPSRTPSESWPSQAQARIKNGSDVTEELQIQVSCWVWIWSLLLLH